MHANETAGRDQGVLLTHFSNISFIDVQLVDIPKMKMHGGKKKETVDVLETPLRQVLQRCH